MATSVIANQDGLESFVKQILMNAKKTNVKMEQNVLTALQIILVHANLDGPESTVKSILMNVKHINAKTMQLAQIW